MIDFDEIGYFARPDSYECINAATESTSVMAALSSGACALTAAGWMAHHRLTAVSAPRLDLNPFPFNESVVARVDADGYRPHCAP